MPVVRPEVFRALYCCDLDLLRSLPSWDLRPVLPALVRMTVMDNGEHAFRKNLFRCIALLDDANTITALLTADFAAISEDVAKEFQMW